MTVVKARINDQWVPLTGSKATIWDTAWGIVAMGTFIPPLAPHVVANTDTLTYPLAATLIAGRRYRVHFQVRAVNPIGAVTNVSIYLRDNGVEIRGHAYGGDPYIYTAGSYVAGAFDWLFTGDNTLHSFEVRATGGGVNIYTDYGLFYVEDIGPVSGSPSTPNPTPSWIAAGLNSGWVNRAGNQAVQYRKLGDMVYMRGVIAWSASAGNPMCTLPPGYRPPAGLGFVTVVNSNTTDHPQYSVNLFVYTDGTVNGFGLTSTLGYFPVDIAFSVTA